MKELDSESNKDVHGQKGTKATESDNKAKKCVICGFELPLQPRKKRQRQDISRNFLCNESRGPVIAGLPTSLEINLAILDCSVQQSSPLNGNRNPEQVTLTKDNDDLVKRYPDCFVGVGNFQGQYHVTGDPSVPGAWLSTLKDACH